MSKRIWFIPACVDKYEDIAPASATAQVHPAQFAVRMATGRGAGHARVAVGAPVEEIEYEDVGPYVSK